MFKSVNKKRIRDLLLLFLWILCFNAIPYNFSNGSKDSEIAYVILWGILIIGAIYHGIKHINNIYKK